MSYSDNPKAICESILGCSLPIHCVWSIDNLTLELPSGIKKVKRFSILYYYYHACSKLLVNSGEFSQNLFIRKSQVYLNTQHGTPLKLMGMDAMNYKNKKITQSYSKNSRWKHLLSPNKYTTEIFRRAYIYSGNVLEAGYPRNDILFLKNNSSDINFLKAKYCVPLRQKVILYAPTWRDTEGKRFENNTQLKIDLVELFNVFGRTHIVILRLHHLITNKEILSDNLNGFVYDLTGPKYDIQELMLISDVLITDYSSIMFDFSNLWRPIIFFAYDFDEYCEKTRGTYFDLEADAPGPVVKTMADLIISLSSLDNWFSEYLEKRIIFHSKFCSLEDGYATRRVINRIIEPVMGLIPKN